MKTYWNFNGNLNAISEWQPNCWIQVTCPTEQDQQELQAAIDEDFVRIHQVVDDAKKMKKQIEVRKILSEVLPFISVSEFAKQYFEKSASWLHQRNNGNEVHGKVATFTEMELKILSDALKDVANKLNNAASALS